VVVHTGDGTAAGWTIGSDDPSDGPDNSGIPLAEATPKGLGLPDTLVGILTTASDLLFTGGREGYFQVLDAKTGALLWKTNLGGQIVNGPMSYEVDGTQYVAIASGGTPMFGNKPGDELLVFALPR